MKQNAKEQIWNQNWKPPTLLKPERVLEKEKVVIQSKNAGAVRLFSRTRSYD